MDAAGRAAAASAQSVQFHTPPLCVFDIASPERWCNQVAAPARDPRRSGSSGVLRSVLILVHGAVSSSVRFSKVNK